MGRGNGILLHLLLLLMVVGWWLDTEELLDGGGWMGGRELNEESAAGGPCLARTARWLAVDTEAALQLDWDTTGARVLYVELLARFRQPP
jgi:hypothetical protein